MPDNPMGPHLSHSQDRWHRWGPTSLSKLMIVNSIDTAELRGA